MELDRPVIRLARGRDGRLNWQGVLGAVDLNERVPTIVIRHGTLLIEDCGDGPGTPLVEMQDVCVTVVNDPLDTLVIEGVARTDVAGPVKVSARLQRPTDVLSATVQLPSVPVGPPLIQRLTFLQPETAAHLRQLSGSGSVRAALTYRPRATPALKYDVTVALQDGTFSHARLPFPLEKVVASARCVDGAVPVARLSASFPAPYGPGRIETSVRDLAYPLPADDKSLSVEPEDFAREADVKIEHLVVSPHLLAQLPAPAPEIDSDYHPDGPMSVACAFRRDSPRRWRKDWVIRAEGARGRFHKFAYELERITGTIEMTTRSDHNNDAAVHLVGYSEGRPVAIKGEIHGHKATSAIDFEIAADRVPLDGKLFEALPGDGPNSARKIAREFLPRRSRELGLDRAPMGLADVRATVHRRGGQTEFENRFLLTFHDSAVLYDLFPLPLEHASAVLDIRPHDHWECRGFRGEHAGGEVRVECHSEPVAAPADNSAPGRTDRIIVDVQGRDVPIDADFEQALAPPVAPGRAALQKTFQTLALNGRLSFNAHVEDRPGQAQDFDATVAVRGCTMKPAFFRYAMNDVSGTVRYVRNRPDEHRPDHVYLTGLTAWHGRTSLGMTRGEITLKPGGGYYGHFEGVRGTALRADADLLAALPPTVRKGLDALKLETPVDVATELRVDAAADPAAPPVVWWDGRRSPARRPAEGRRRAQGGRGYSLLLRSTRRPPARRGPGRQPAAESGAGLRATGPERARPVRGGARHAGDLPGTQSGGRVILRHHRRPSAGRHRPRAALRSGPARHGHRPRAVWPPQPGRRPRTAGAGNRQPGPVGRRPGDHRAERQWSGRRGQRQTVSPAPCARCHQGLRAAFARSDCLRASPPRFRHRRTTSASPQARALRQRRQPPRSRQLEPRR
jgi:hypothetical protein